MKWIWKLLRRAMLLWCLYGVGLLCYYVNPIMEKVGHVCGTRDLQSWQYAFRGWASCIGSLGIVLIAIALLHEIAKKLFNEK